MKKFLTFLSVIILTFSACFALNGCSFIRETGNIDFLPDSLAVSQNVVINSNEAEGENARQEMSLVDAVAKVERSSVAILTSSGAGSGVIISVNIDGQTDSNTAYIITCHHVIANKGVINLYIPDESFSYVNQDYIFGGVIGSESTTPYFLEDNTVVMEKAVTLVGGDQVSDIAVLKLDLTKKALSGNTLSASDLCYSSIPPQTYEVRRGETVFSVANPTGILPGSVCAGVVSYLEREVYLKDVGNNMMLMQIDAPTNPGSSGGGLYNLYGELIGITNSGNTSYNSINFAIPVSTTAEDGFDNGFVSVATQLMGTYTGDNYGYVSGRKERIGITVTKGDDSGSEYVYIVSVTEGSVAQTLGLQANDVIQGLTINGVATTITSYSQFTSLMGGLKIGDTVTISISRILTGVMVTNKDYTYTVKQNIFCDTGIYPEA